MLIQFETDQIKAWQFIYCNFVLSYFLVKENKYTLERKRRIKTPQNTCGKFRRKGSVKSEHFELLYCQFDNMINYKLNKTIYIYIYSLVRAIVYLFLNPFANSYSVELTRVFNNCGTFNEILVLYVSFFLMIYLFLQIICPCYFSELNGTILMELYNNVNKHMHFQDGCCCNRNNQKCEKLKVFQMLNGMCKLSIKLWNLRMAVITSYLFYFIQRFLRLN